MCDSLSSMYIVCICICISIHLSLSLYIYIYMIDLRLKVRPFCPTIATCWKCLRFHRSLQVILQLSRNPCRSFAVGPMLGVLEEHQAGAPFLVSYDCFKLTFTKRSVHVVLVCNEDPWLSFYWKPCEVFQSCFSPLSHTTECDHF